VSGRGARHIVLAVGLVLAGCGIPRDPEGTLERIRGGTIRVGVIESHPWATTDPRPEGVEVSLLEGFAEEVGAEVRWVPGSESDLVAALEVHSLDVVIGGLTADSPWAEPVGLTSPYLTTRLVVGIPAGSPSLEDLDGVRVAVEIGTEAEGLLDREDAIPQPLEDLTAARGPVAVEDWALQDLGLRDSGIELDVSEHVMAVPHGENALLTNLEQFLSEAETKTDALLEEAEPR
jgi:polar amino acid transport system substrate-binding protein